MGQNEVKESYNASSSGPISPQRSVAGSLFDLAIDAEQQKDSKIHRGLKSRHLQLIALGGCIGTGLFVGSGAALAQCGPAAVLISYMIMSFVIWSVMNSLAEMTCYLPIPGNGAQNFIGNYLDKSLGFAAGWNYWYSFSMLVGSEITAAALVIEYWDTGVSTAVWITIFLVVVIALNFVAVKFYGESEFWFASLKIICLVGLIIVGVVIFFGGAPAQHGILGFHYWKNDMAFKQHLVTGNTGKFLAVVTAIIRSGYSFILSPELIVTAGGECQRPRHNIAKASKRFIYRLAFFYIIGSLIIGVVVSSSNEHLLSGSSNASASPFVIGIQNAGIKVLNHIVNAVILTSAWSSGNSFLYAGSRALYAMSVDNMAPKFFSKVNRWGTPYYSVGATSLLGLLAYLNVSSSSANVFTWLSNICTISGFIAWIFVSAAHLRWRRAVSFNGLDSRVPFRTPWQPYTTWFVIVFISIITLVNGYAVFFAFDGADFVAAYVTLPIFLVIYAAHKAYVVLIKKERFRWLIPIDEIDVVTGLDMVEAEEASYPERIPKNVVEKVWYWIA